MSAVIAGAEIDGQPSLDDLRQMIRRALNGGMDFYGPEAPWVMDVGAGACIVQQGEKHFRYSYELNPDGLSVTLGTPVPVKLVWRDAHDEPVAGAARESGDLAFVTDLRGITLAEGSGLTSIQVCRDGSWKHQKHGLIVIDEGIRDSLVANFNSNVRKVGDLPLDYDHELGPAPGWIVGLRKEGDALFADCDLTPVGREKIRSKEYRFFSPELSFDWKDPESGDSHGPTLFGGALTNKPFFRGMAAINCSEIAPPAGGGAPTGAPPQEGEDEDMDATKLTELEQRLKAVEAENSALKASEGRITALEAENAVLKAAEERRVVTDAVEGLRFSEGRVVLAPAARGPLVDELMKLPAANRQPIVEALKGLQFAELGERGFTGAGAEGPGTLTATEERIVASLAESMGVKPEEAQAQFLESKRKRQAA